MDSLYPPPRSHTATDGHKKGQKSRQPGLVSTSKKGQQLKVKKSCQPSLVSTRNSARLSKRALSSQSEFRVDVWDKETAPTRLNGKEKDPGRLLSDFVHQEALLQVCVDRNIDTSDAYVDMHIRPTIGSLLSCKE